MFKQRKQRRISLRVLLYLMIKVASQAQEGTNKNLFAI